MRIGVIGAGRLGGTLARLLCAHGHEVAVANSREPATLRDLVAELEGCTAVDAERAAMWAELVVEAIPFGRFEELPFHAMEGKILVSTSNHHPDRDGAIDLGGRCDTELIAQRAEGARVVKAFNTIWHEHLAHHGNHEVPREQRRAVFLAGDDDEAKQVVAGLVEELGFGAVDTGTLHAGGLLQQPGSPIHNEEISVAEAEEILAPHRPS